MEIDFYISDNLWKRPVDSTTLFLVRSPWQIMQLHRFDNIQEFWHSTQAYLLQHQVENNVLLSISHTLLHNPERYPGKPYLAIVQTSGQILAVAIRTPPQKLILSKAQNMDALRLIAQDLRQEQLPGTMGLNTSWLKISA